MFSRCVSICVCDSVCVDNCYRMVGDSESAQLESLQREVKSCVHDLSSAQRRGGSVRRQRLRRIDRTPSEHPHHD